MMQSIFEAFAFPNQCCIGRRIFKSTVQEQVELCGADKKTFVEQVESIRLDYSLEPGVIAIAAYEDDARQYLAIRSVSISLRTSKAASHIAELMQRSFMDPVFLELVVDGRCMLHLATKRRSLADRSKVTLEQVANTSWFDLEDLHDLDRQFLASLNISQLPFTHFHAFYQAVMVRVAALKCAELTGAYDLTKPDRTPAVDAIRKAQQKQSELRARLKSERNLGEKVTLNTQIKQLEEKIAADSLSL